MTKGFLKDILRLNQTVYSFKQLTLLFPNTEPKTLKSRLSYYVKHGDLYHIRRGLYAKDENYDRYELATKIMTPAYISFESVLAAKGIIFQFYDQIFVASYQSKSILCDGQQYTFRKLKDSILTNTAGIELLQNYSIATAERAFLDTLYSNTSYYFDNLSPINWHKVFDILPIYKNKRMEKAVDLYYKTTQEPL
jgi:predicted transcriptional regulator of viral defense system